jgi:threonine/homoserine/homoserine lactone efflux protein
MTLETLLLFTLTIVPLVFTPGPDILLVVAQAFSHGKAAALRSNAGILLGYVAHGVLATLGVTAVVAATPWLFELMRWAGVTYLAWLAARMLYSATKTQNHADQKIPGSNLLAQGFFTAFLNPKGLLVFFAILPPFIDPQLNIPLQAAALSGLFIILCGLGYTAVILLAAKTARAGSFSNLRRRWLEAIAGTLLGYAAVKLAAAAR